MGYQRALVHVRADLEGGLLREKLWITATYISHIGDAGFNQLFGFVNSFCSVFDSSLCLV